MIARRSHVRIPSLVLAMGVLAVGSAAYADLGAGTLVVAEAPYTHGSDLALQIGVPYVVWILGVWPTELGNSAPATIPVWVKSSHFGNTIHTAARVGLWDYEFTYTPPAISAGYEFDACGAAIVSYGNGQEGGYDARAICIPSWVCTPTCCAALLWFADASGAERACPPTAVEDASWSLIRKLYR
jgi:hypothetical protein